MSENTKQSFKNSEEQQDKINFRSTSPKQHIQIEYIPKTLVLFTRKLMPHYRNEVFSLDRWNEIIEICDKAGITISNPIILTFHVKPLEHFLLQDCEVEFATVIDREKSVGIPKGTAGVRSFGGFKAATLLHVGAYDERINNHVAMLRWINENNLTVNGPISEEFIVSFLDINDENKYVVKIIIPIK